MVTIWSYLEHIDFRNSPRLRRKVWRMMVGNACLQNWAYIVGMRSRIPQTDRQIPVLSDTIPRTADGMIHLELCGRQNPKSHSRWLVRKSIAADNGELQIKKRKLLLMSKLSKLYIKLYQHVGLFDIFKFIKCCFLPMQDEVKIVVWLMKNVKKILTLRVVSY